MEHDYDVIIIGSGFGGSVSALRLTEKGYRVGVLEAGRRYLPKDFPKTNWNVRKFFWFPRLGMRGIQRMTLLKDVLVLSGAGVGGGSLVYANTLYRPHDAFYDDPQWAGVTNWKDELEPFYTLAERMLGAVENPTHTPADEVLLEVGRRLGVQRTFQPTPVGVFFGDPETETSDPYFGGAGPARSGCRECGGCMVGCRFNAKNSLDRNYLYLAEQAGAAVHAEHEVVDVQPLPGGGFAIDAERPGAWFKKEPFRFTAGQVVFSAGALGSTKLLLKLAETGRFPDLSARVGDVVRTNSEALLGATAKSTDVDYSKGVAITSSIHPEPRTHIEPVRYSKGSNVMGLLATVLTDGGGRVPRQLRFLWNVIRHPIGFLRTLSVRRWAERSVILLVMQSYDNSLRVLRKQGMFGTRLTSVPSSGEPHPSYIPVGNEASRIAADVMDGFPGSSINEVLLDVPTTAHILGGACIGGSANEGVVDPYHRVYGHEGLHVVDGAAIGANLGVNPSLSITALAERAMSMWPNKGQPDPRPAVGEPYVRTAPVAPSAPVVSPKVLGVDVWGAVGD
ncbi:MAG: GMC family oxidoreductase [Acidimicrobiia bacterium]|nr:GMC family oxidoreductase [Acidimicrobiia bacterium]